MWRAELETGLAESGNRASTKASFPAEPLSLPALCRLMVLALLQGSRPQANRNIQLDEQPTTATTQGNANHLTLRIPRKPVDKSLYSNTNEVGIRHRGLAAFASRLPWSARRMPALFRLTGQHRPRGLARSSRMAAHSSRTTARQKRTGTT